MVTVLMRETVGGLVRRSDRVAKLKTRNLFLGVFVGDSRKFMLAKISRYTVLFPVFDLLRKKAALTN